MNKILLGSAAGVALTVGTAVFAQAATPPAQKTPPANRFMQTELRTDVPGHVAKMFARLDTNKDGFISKAEVDAVETQRDAGIKQRAARFDPAKIFARLDTNDDGKISQAEADAAHNARAHAKGGQPAKATGAGTVFARLDTNRDGVVTREEFEAGATQMHARLEQAAMQRGGFAEHMFQAADLNKDGKVSAAEVQQMALQHFDRDDLNHDGKLTPDERKQARQAQKPPRKV